ncbi:MAG TPA: RagB/SusD family nutrient uptake outer membrane protein [Leeuwenhoekiella sp.]|uniref:RagB/SusD family nutrient uptake outer membrane protein n=1 Tax=Leeuwenhoekiella palythoae TaxID=573501 RepID=UPI000E9B960B|nr:RagB/SusD family nutrient uptake outer membrane protein [Leeuwenhoekiella palythoae]UBZ09518.1 RagB/SusD family nutrient uptake outer membrane protein [Leeuwenhoekiella palythoae]HAX16048.1 RagB/SusD family nutrient uptake outer membrane protein [Leeuwenhoekiella sp.]HBO30615.1 RagB/SusD family nutrient uptake outer membrane protein [Leeuwenhoekiella sp.]HCQ77361.1 RagB/SusD family nutrient uptake outer membrane protein [Leeuwenhoekiella sp.]|tara:strand:+ start:469 stop:1962 length:1494 start_codon:yes stop_codon:yes gene_type:complete
MQTRITHILAILLAALSLSCDSYLDLRPENGTVRQEFWQTKEDVQAAVIGIYSAMLNTPPSESDLTLAEYLFMYGELRGGMVSPAAFTSNDQSDIITTNILPSNSITTWSQFYRIINYCNTVIDLAPDVLEEDPTLTQEQLNNYLSEALAIRAYLYFTLAKSFKDVPLKLDATLSDGDNFQLETTPQDQIFAQVLVDLNEAERLSVEDYGNTPENKGRITKFAINAMQADLHLWLENYDEALVAADKIINSGQFELIDASPQWFTTVFAIGNSTESIFELQYTPENRGPFYGIFLQQPQYLAAPAVLEEVFGVDFDEPENKDVRGERASLVPGTNEIYKFTGLNEDQRKALQESDTHWFVYRYSDALLMKAEALNELGRGAEAISIIEDLREKRAAIAQTQEQVSPQDQDGIRRYILAERAREFAFEGKRWFDVLRNARKNNYAYLDILLGVALRSAPANQQQSILAKLQDPNSHYLPINTFELYTNKALTQNPFYK